MTPARWLSLTSTASDRLERWLTPAAGPHGRLLEGPQARRGLAGVEHLHGRIAGVGRGDEPRVRVAMPERWPRKLSAVRSAVRIGRSGPVTSITVSPGTSSGAVGDVPGQRQRRVELAEGLGGTGPPGQHPVLAGPQGELRRRRPRAPAPR